MFSKDVWINQNSDCLHFRSCVRCSWDTKILGHLHLQEQKHLPRSSWLVNHFMTELLWFLKVSTLQLTYVCERGKKSFTTWLLVASCYMARCLMLCYYGKGTKISWIKKLKGVVQPNKVCLRQDSSSKLLIDQSPYICKVVGIYEWKWLCCKGNERLLLLFPLNVDI